MQIECKLKREGGSDIDIGGLIYEFRPLPDGAHVADVADEEHIARFLAIPEGYRLYKPGQKEDELTVGLFGSSSHPASFEIGGKTYRLEDIVASAHAASGLSPEEWNELSEDARADLIDEELDKLAEAAGGADEALTQAREDYKAKFGKYPHAASKLDTILAKLNEAAE